MDNKGNSDGVHTRAETFGEDEAVETGDSSEAQEARMRARIKDEARKHLEQTMRELEADELHGLVIVRLNNEGQTAGSIAVASTEMRDMGIKLQELSMDLVLPPGARRELRGLMDLLRNLG